MTDFLHVALLGISAGALIGLGGLGLVVIYRGSGVLNFGIAAIGVSGAFFYWELLQRGVSIAVAFTAGVAAAAIAGLLIQLIVMQRLRNSAPIIRVVATLGILVLLQGIGTQRYGDSSKIVPNLFPQNIWHLTKQITITSDRVYLFVVAVLVSLILEAIYRYTKFGMRTTAVAENQRASAALGCSPNFIAGINWAMGSALAAGAAILSARITTVSVLLMTTLLLGTLAAALIGNFTSFALTMVGGIVIGLLQTELNYYSPHFGPTGVGLSNSVPFFVILILLMVRGRALPLRDHFLSRLPAVGSGHVNVPLVAVAGLVALGLCFVGTTNWASGLATTFAAALIILSIVVVTGYAGQISLASFAFAGFGAWVAARLIADNHVPFPVAVLIGVVATVPLGVLFALPALRTRGINLAILTLGLGSAIEFMVFDNPTYNGGYTGMNIGSPTIFGWKMDAVSFPDRYAAVSFVLLLVGLLLVSNVRRGRSGRRLLAVRTNERAAAALGVSVTSAKMYAFGVSAGLAAMGGIMLLLQTPNVSFANVSNSESPTILTFAVIGGLGFLLGPVIGATLFTGAVGTMIANAYYPGLAQWLQVVAGGILILLILQTPNGAATLQYHQGRVIEKHFRRLTRRGGDGLRPGRTGVRGTDGGGIPARTSLLGESSRVTGKRLAVEDVTVRYGGVVAVDGVSFSVAPGQVVGLIGPNGAGKTSIIDAISGFNRVAGGRVKLAEEDVTRWSAVERSRAGICRSFQSLEVV